MAIHSARPNSSTLSNAGPTSRQITLPKRNTNRKQQQEPRIEFADYPRIAPGIYPGQCKRARTYRDPQFKRWIFLLNFDVYDASFNCIADVPMYLSLGNGEKPYAGRRSRYFPIWCRANGGLPIRRDRMAPRVFVGRMAQIEIRDTKGEFPYSVVNEIVQYDTGKPSAKPSRQAAVITVDTQALP